MEEMTLVESVERIVIEALAEMHTSTTRSPANEPNSGIVTREIIIAIADKLDASEDGALEHIGQYEPSVYSGEVAADWLRSQAQERDDG